MISWAAGSCAAITVFLAWSGLARRVATRRPPGTGPEAVPRRGRRRPRWSTRAARPDHARLLDELARRVRAGGSLGHALVELCASDEPVAAPVRAATSRYGRGVALGPACQPVADDADPVLALVGATLCAVAGVGGAGGRALDAAAAALRERAAVAADVRAQAATARLSALVLVLLPLAFAAWTVVGDDDARAFLLGSRLGWAVMAAGLALDAVGALWMRRLVAGAVQP